MHALSNYAVCSAPDLMSPLPQPHPIKPLCDLVQVLPGYAVRRLSQQARGSYRILQARNLGLEGAVAWDRLDHCEETRGAMRAELADGDVLLAVRTTAPRAFRLHSPPPRVCAGGQFAILRPRPHVVDPDYLCWCLNAEPTLARLSASYRGSTMPFLALAELSAFEIDVPDLAQQRRIARISGLRLRQAGLERRRERALDVLLAAACRLNSNPPDPHP